MKDEELCEALIHKEISFDIHKLRVIGHNHVELFINNPDGVGFAITYEY